MSDPQTVEAGALVHDIFKGMLGASSANLF
jgi:HD superfamily phosphodiesterase